MLDEVIPSEFREKYKALRSDICHLHREWGIFRRLYVSGGNTVELLNKAASGFFRICEDLLADDILLSISRLGEQKQTSGRDNLTLEHLVASVDAERYADLRRELDELLLTSKNKCVFARKQRNRRIAHNDLSTRLHVKSLPPPITTDVDAALESIRALMNAIEKYFNSPVYCNDKNIAFVDYPHFLTFDADGAQLIDWLHKADECISRNQ